MALLSGMYPAGLAISVITHGEVLEGVMFSRSPAADMQNWRRFLSAFDIIDVTPAIAEIWGELRGVVRSQIPREQRFPALDLLIAATAIHFDMTLITHNGKDYEKVPNLRMEVPPL